MRAIHVVRDDTERVAPCPARAERGSIVRAQNEIAVFLEGKSKATRLVLGHVRSVANRHHQLLLARSRRQ